MKNGDLVTGKPIETDGPEQLPDEVTGTLEIAHGSIGSTSWSFFLVNVKDKDGAEVPVECKSVRTANKGEKVTVLT